MSINLPISFKYTYVKIVPRKHLLWQLSKEYNTLQISFIRDLINYLEIKQKYEPMGLRFGTCAVRVPGSCWPLAVRSNWDFLVGGGRSLRDDAAAAAGIRLGLDRLNVNSWLIFRMTIDFIVWIRTENGRRTSLFVLIIFPCSFTFFFGEGFFFFIFEKRIVFVVFVYLQRQWYVRIVFNN